MYPILFRQSTRLIGLLWLLLWSVNLETFAQNTQQEGRKMSPRTFNKSVLDTYSQDPEFDYLPKEQTQSTLPPGLV
ncbi:MAG: hypothetical protein HC912_10740 [Saprospiraceae bacterium]|nr:hypothetical protein [Saprospiraceae bacterium]